jgi:hypothetical protein
MSDQHKFVERYYTIIEPSRVQATVSSKETKSAGLHPAKLEKISATGAILLLAAPPEFEGCQVSIVSSKLREPLLISAQIHWVQPNPAGDWHLGCAFDPRLTDEVFMQLLQSGLLERRSTPREPVRIRIHLQLEPATRIPAIISDISRGGLCCLTTTSAPKGTRQVYAFASIEGKEFKIPLKVRWSMHTCGQYFIGTEFVRQADSALLRRVQLEQLDACSDANELVLSPAGVTS